MSPLVFLLLAAAAAFGLYRTMRSRAENIRYLEEAGEEAPLMISHLSGALQRLAQETRALRLSLEDPLRQLRALPGRLSPEFDARAIDQSLMNTSREVGDWVNGVSRLSEEDIEHLLDVGANTSAVRDVFGAAGFGFELGGGGTKRAKMIAAQLEELQRELLRIERALQIQSDPYR
jgi:hypothetical protein